MSIFAGIKRIFRIEDDYTKTELPKDKVKHGDELQKMADETECAIELEMDNGSKQTIYPKDIYMDRVFKRHSQMTW